MLLVQHLTSDPLQQVSLVLPDGSTLFLELYYRQSQLGWFFTKIQWIRRGGAPFTINGLRVVNNPNILRQWKNIFSFGLACFTIGNREPTQQQDFASGQSKLYVLTTAEAQEYENYLRTGKT